MKFSAVALLALPAVAHAWTFTWGGNVDDGKANKGCTAITLRKGTKFSWNRGGRESCCIRMFNSRNCGGQQIGLSCPDWSKTAGQNVAAYKVTDC